MRRFASSWTGVPVGVRAARQRTARGASVITAAADYYRTLGVGNSASKKDIKSAYRQLARKYHPDVNKEPGAEERFKEVSARGLLP